MSVKCYGVFRRHAVLLFCAILLAGLAGAGCVTTQTGSGGQSEGDEIRMSETAEKVLFEDSMKDNWQANWFLDGKNAILENSEDGLLFTCPSSGVNKREDRATFDAYHAVLWTKQEFEGDIRITYEFAKKGTSLLYIQAQGVGQPPYEKDIYVWRNLREVAAMKKYFTYMTLRSLSFRENIRFKRYPWNDPVAGDRYDNELVRPMIEYEGEYGTANAGTLCRVLVESREGSLRLRLQEVANPENVIEHTWDAASNADPMQPVFTRKGRIGLRNMGGCWARYKNFKVEQL